MSILGSHFNTQDLTEEEKRQYSKIVQLREKREKMQSNKKWRNEKENREETLDFLRSYQLPYVVVDMPQGHPSSVPPVVEATADLAVVRFHGHSDKWTSKDIYERFGYLYAEDELRPWAAKLSALADRAEAVHALMNNCYRDYAQVNARQLATLLSSEDSR